MHIYIKNIKITLLKLFYQTPLHIWKKKLYAFYMTEVLLDVIICREILTSVLSALVKNLIKENFYGKRKKQLIF